MSDSALASVDAVDCKALIDALAQVGGGVLPARMPHECPGAKVANGPHDLMVANQALAEELAGISEMIEAHGGCSHPVVLAARGAEADTECGFAAAGRVDLAKPCSAREHTTRVRVLVDAAGAAS